MVVDTHILIDHFHGNTHATAFVREALLRGDTLIISIATVSELLAGMRLGEEEDTDAILSLFQIFPADEPIARMAGAFLNKYGRKHHIDLGDALIAATAQVHGMLLITRNIRHYPMDEIEAQVPYERGHEG